MKRTLFLYLIVLLSGIIFMASGAYAAAPDYILIQGVITGETPDQISISISTSESGGSQLMSWGWTVVADKSQEIDPDLWGFALGKVYIDKSGFFNVHFSTRQKIFLPGIPDKVIYFDQPCYVEIQAGKGNNWSTLTPRLPVSSALCVLNARNVVSNGKIDVYSKDQNSIAITGHAPFVGVYGTSETGTGVSGVGLSPNGYGVYAASTGEMVGLNAVGGINGITAVGGTYGVYISGVMFYGAIAKGGQYGGWFLGGIGNGVYGFTYANKAGQAGVFGVATKEVSAGVQGFSLKGDGVIGESNSATYAGVHAISKWANRAIHAEGPIVHNSSFTSNLGTTTFTMQMKTYLDPNDNNNPKSVIDSTSYNPMSIPKTAGRPLYLNPGLVVPGGSVIVGSKEVSGYAFAVNGKAYVTASYSGSDRRFKTNIQPIAGALGKIEKLNGVYYGWNDAFKKMNKNPGSWHEEIGFIGQEVQKEFPELVTESGKEKYIGLEYERMAAVLVQTIKELKAENDKLEARIVKLGGKI